MKCVYLFLVTLLCYTTNAKEFTLSVGTSEQTCYIGDIAEFVIKITTDNTFQSTVFISVQSDLNVELNNSISNPPYQDVVCKVHTKAQDVGEHVLKLKGANGDISDIVVCKLKVLPLEYWKSIKAPIYGSFLLRNSKGRVTLPSCNSGSLRLLEYDSIQWKEHQYNSGFGSSYRWLWGGGRDVAFDSSGNVWFAASPHIIMYDGEHYNAKPLPFTVNSTNVQIELIVGQNQTVYCIVCENEKLKIAKLVDNSWKEIECKYWGVARPHKNVASTTDNSLWIAPDGTDNVLFRIKNDSVVAIDKFRDYFFFSKICSYQNKLYGLTESILTYFENETWNEIKLPYDKISSSSTMAIGNTGEVYIVSEFGLSIYENGTWSNIERKSSPLSGFQVEDIIVDKKNNVWLYSGKECVVYNPHGIRNFLITTSINETDTPNKDSKTLIYQQTDNSLRVTLPSKQVSALMIYDIKGNLVKLDNLSSVSNHDLYEVDISSLSTGGYLLKIDDHTAKFFVVH